MNPQIKKLAEQAGYRPLPGFDFANSLEEQFLEKFAELIVKECFQVVDDYAVAQATTPETYLGENLKVSMKITDAAWKIKQRFGIE